MGLKDDARREYDRMQACVIQQHPDASWVRKQFSNGTLHFAFWCPTCRRAVTAERYPTGGAWVTRDVARRLSARDPETFEVLAGELRYRLCVRCRTTVPCDGHHIAPRALFPDADEWPILPLCDTCHRRWHTIMTPGLCTPYDAAEHARLLAGWLRADQLAALVAALHRMKGEAA